VTDQNSTRRRRVVKYRGTTHGTNEYPFLIDEGGISILPLASIGLKHKVSTERVSSGIPRLEAMLGGTGYYKGTTVLVSGTAGPVRPASRPSSLAPPASAMNAVSTSPTRRPRTSLCATWNVPLCNRSGHRHAANLRRAKVLRRSCFSERTPEMDAGSALRATALMIRSPCGVAAIVRSANGLVPEDAGTRALPHPPTPSRDECPGFPMPEARDER
jgi:hypothetical protein